MKGENGLLFLRGNYSRWFRRIADAAGIPKEVWNRDARPGAATEADAASVPIEVRPADHRALSSPALGE